MITVIHRRPPALLGVVWPQQKPAQFGREASLLQHHSQSFPSATAKRPATRVTTPVTEGFETTLCGKTRENPSRPPVFDGEQEAKVIALRLGPAPKGFANWSLRLLADKVVELGIVESVSHETVRRTLKKTA
jgi:Homeodomain-like domain